MSAPTEECVSSAERWKRLEALVQQLERQTAETLARAQTGCRKSAPDPTRLTLIQGGRDA